MGKTYEKAPAFCRTVIGDLLAKYHGELCAMDLVVDLLLVRAPRDAEGYPTGPALKSSSGFPAAATISITKLKDRVMGRGDCEILIDGDRYSKWSEDYLRALLDHELEHLEFTGNVDDIGRPKLKLRPHDVEFGWFDATARRHGDHAVEVQQAKRFFGEKSIRQLYLPGWEDGIPSWNDPDTVKPSITRRVAAAKLSEIFGEQVSGATLMYASVPHREGDETRIVEAWVDHQDRALIFQAGQVIESTPHLQLSARWAKKDEAA